MTVKQKCLYCGAIYGTVEVEDSLGLEYSHGVCPAVRCQERAMREMLGVIK